MGINTKHWLRQLSLALVLAIVTGTGTGFIMMQKSEAVNSYKVDQQGRDISDLKVICEKKADKSMVVTVKNDLSERLTRFENNIEIIHADIKELLKRK